MTRKLPLTRSGGSRLTNRPGYPWRGDATARRELNCQTTRPMPSFTPSSRTRLPGGLETVQRAVARLKRQGLSRRDAIHAIGSVPSDHLHVVMNAKDEDTRSITRARYDAAVERLTASEWRRRFSADGYT